MDYHIHSDFSDGDSSFQEIIKECAGCGCKDISFADHCGEDGRFMFSLGYRRNRNLEGYVTEITSLKVPSLEDLGVRIHAGLEISTWTDEYEEQFSEHVVPFIDDLDILLVDGWYIDDPVKCALQTLKIVKKACKNDFPVFIAHPDFDEITSQDVVNLMKHGIGLELNEAKFFLKEKLAWEKLMEELGKRNKKIPRIILGSDAHALHDSGRVGKVQDFATSMDLLDFLHMLP
ncbi:MAG: PHP domain-containing protein [Candidatus Hodarchaeota archaeon]